MCDGCCLLSKKGHYKWWTVITAQTDSTTPSTWFVCRTKVNGPGLRKPLTNQPYAKRSSPNTGCIILPTIITRLWGESMSRRSLAFALTIALTITCTFLASQTATPSQPAMGDLPVVGIANVTFKVSDVAKARA